MKIIRTIGEMHAWADEVRAAGKRIGFVPTMGYLHEGHLSLVRVARARSDLIVVSIFVNPIQFGPKEDLARYPRDFARDSALLEREHTDVIFYPDEKEMYPGNYSTYIDVEGLTETLCGERRPGHFRGVATVVAKLFNAVKPFVAVFGAKDAQQAFVIKRMARDLDFDIEIVVAPTVREPDGLAMSSRNTYLSPDERAEAPVLHTSLQQAEQMIARGERDANKVTAAMKELIGKTRGRVDYVSIVDTETLHEVKEINGKVLIALAVFFGPTRLIDNAIVNTESLAP
jgi:pantoate--beta-alanine ligase